MLSCFYVHRRSRVLLRSKMTVRSSCVRDWLWHPCASRCAEDTYERFCTSLQHATCKDTAVLTKVRPRVGSSLVATITSSGDSQSLYVGCDAIPADSAPTVGAQQIQQSTCVSSRPQIRIPHSPRPARLLFALVVWSRTTHRGGRRSQGQYSSGSITLEYAHRQSFRRRSGSRAEDE